MLPFERRLEYYVDSFGRIPFVRWLDSIRDHKVRRIIDSRLYRLKSGNFGLCESVGAGVVELKIYYGPGFRIYVAPMGTSIIILLLGGDKSTQDADIKRAIYYWCDYKERIK